MWKKHRRILQIMSVMFLILFAGCRSNQEEIFSESAETPSQPLDEEISETVIPEVDYDSPNYIGPDKSELQDLPPIEDDTLSGELLIKKSASYDNIDLLAQEFMQLHPDVKISFEEAASFNERLSLVICKYLLPFCSMPFTFADCSLRCALNRKFFHLRKKKLL